VRVESRSVPPPNYTQCPNVFYDEIMPEIETMAEMKVTLVVIRQTFGWHREEHKLTLDLLEALTGMNRQQVVAGVKAAMARGYIGRRKVGQAYLYGLRVKGYEDHTPSQYENHTPLKESKKESITKANAFEGNPKNVGLEKYITDRMYEAYKAAGFPKWNDKEYGFHVQRAKVLIEDIPDLLDEEIERLPKFFVDYYTDWNPKADAVSSLREMRRRAAREDSAARREPDVERPSTWQQRKEAEEEEAKQEAKRQYDLKYPTYGTRSDGSWGVKES
jgi:hypothetical protein